MSKNYYVYLLKSTKGTTYVGATVNLERRLRQHNKELVGGAKATTAKVKKGESWKRVCYVYNFPTWQAALQFEWRWKRLGRKFPRRMNPLERRLRALDLLFTLESSTSKAVPFSEWGLPPEVYIELDEVYNYY